MPTPESAWVRRPEGAIEGVPSLFEDEHAPLYTVGQVAEILGVQPAFLRRLDGESVVQPSRSNGGQRRYSRAEIGRVQRVSEMAGEGMTLAGIRRILVLEAEVARLREELERERNRRATPSPRR
jgi:MerR family transcriptional regulator/heat shock protein HspR